MTALSHSIQSARIVSLVTDLRAGTPVTRITARNSLVQIGNPEVVAALILELAAPGAHTRWEAAKALAEIADPSAAMALVNLLDDEDGDVRWVASDALAAMGKFGLVAVLQGLIQHARSIAFCQSAHHALHELSKKGFGETIKPVLATLEASEPALSAPNAAYDLLLEMGDFDEATLSRIGTH